MKIKNMVAENNEDDVVKTPDMAPRYSGGRRRLLPAMFVAAILITVGFVGLVKFAEWISSSNFPVIDSSRWQAVFLTNDQVYFGHLKEHNREYVSLMDIFYLRPSQALQQGQTSEGTGLNLVKLGAELHGPENTMYIPKERILFWEDMRNDSQVVQAIDAFLKQQ